MKTSAVVSQARLPASNGVRLLTAADLAAMPTHLPSGDVRYELDDGGLIVMSPPGYRHGRVGGMFFGFLQREGEFQGWGEACDETGIVLRRNPDRIVGPDAVFIHKRSLPCRVSPEGYLETIPELVVEVRSPNDTNSEIESKAREYLAAGVVVVWSADPEARTVTAYRSSRPAEVFTAAGELTIPDVIPTFRVPLSQLFQD